jgi:hypothetical protein
LANQIHILVLPSHTTAILQALVLSSLSPINIKKITEAKLAIGKAFALSENQMKKIVQAKKIVQMKISRPEERQPQPIESIFTIARLCDSPIEISLNELVFFNPVKFFF